MTSQNFLPELEKIFRSFFKIDSIELTNESSAEDIPAWDSLNHMSLMGEIERAYNIEFDFFELMDFQNVGDLIEGIQSKLNN